MDPDAKKKLIQKARTAGRGDTKGSIGELSELADALERQQ